VQIQNNGKTVMWVKNKG